MCIDIDSDKSRGRICATKNNYITKMVTFESMHDVYFDGQTSEGNA
jgi:hypothetical protein